MKQDYSLSPTSRSGRPRRPVEIAMTPVIDVDFLLLVFFLTTSSFQKIENILPTGLSTSPSEKPAGSVESQADPSDDAVEQVIIKISGSGLNRKLSINDAPVDFAQLPVRLDAISSINSDVPIIIDPSKEVTAKDAIAVYDAARRSAFARVFFAIRQPK